MVIGLGNNFQVSGAIVTGMFDFDTAQSALLMGTVVQMYYEFVEFIIQLEISAWCKIYIVVFFAGMQKYELTTFCTRWLCIRRDCY